jgi:hypothetical protein
MAVALKDPIRLPSPRWLPDDLDRRLHAYEPRTELGRIVKDCFAFLPSDLAGELLDRISATWVVGSQLHAVRIYGDGDFTCRHEPWCRHRREVLGVVSDKLVTDAGVQYLVDCFQNLQEPELFKFHGIGTGTTAEAIGNTALVTELTTEYNPNSTRATGSLTEGASANIFRTVGTNTLDSGTPAVTEHGILTQAATGGGTLLDRSVFSAINLVGANGDGLASTYDLTIASGG